MHRRPSFVIVMFPHDMSMYSRDKPLPDHGCDKAQKWLSDDRCVTENSG